MIQMIESTQGSDAAAVERTLAGDPDAYRVLVERHSRNLFRLAYRMTGNEQDAEEIVQDAFLRAYRKLAIGAQERDRKSTRLNSSHGYISYAVFCLKKKK